MAKLGFHGASGVLALRAGRLSAQWQGRWGHRIVAVESFVNGHLLGRTGYKAGGRQRFGGRAARQVACELLGKSAGLTPPWATAVAQVGRLHRIRPAAPFRSKPIPEPKSGR